MDRWILENHIGVLLVNLSIPRRAMRAVADILNQLLLDALCRSSPLHALVIQIHAVLSMNVDTRSIAMKFDGHVRCKYAPVRDSDGYQNLCMPGCVLLPPNQGAWW